MKLNAAPRILIVAGVCIAALIGLVVSEGAARDGGQEVLLRMQAVDPRALLSGHYVDINLTERLDDECPAGANQRWIALRPDNEAYVLAGGAGSRDQAQQVGPLPVRGSFSCSPAIAVEGGEPIPGFTQLDIGISRFHINQADALRIEDILRAQRFEEGTRAYAIVSVGRDGRARLRGIMVDGERLELSWL